MINDLRNLQQYIASACKVPCEIAIKDTGAEENSLGMVFISSGDDFRLDRASSQACDISINFEIRIVVGRKNNIKGYEILERLLQNLGGFAEQHGHRLTGSGRMEYTDNTFEISVPYTMHLHTQKIT